MIKVWTVFAVLAAFLLVAPVIEHEALESSNVFTAVGNADGGAGGD